MTRYAAFCACCTPPAPTTPTPILNRPGLNRIDYRIGTFARFRAAMTLAIARDPRLAAFTTRDSDDMAISILESFSMIGDILAFYSEMLANELYLRTARESDSVRRLIALPGYRMRPGLAATTDLAFALDNGSALTLRRGLKTMSVPKAGERPVFFETLEEIAADSAFNDAALFGMPLAFEGFAAGRSGGPVTALPEGLAVGDTLLIWGPETVEVKRVRALPVARDGPRLAFGPAIGAPDLSAQTAAAAKSAGRLAFFGSDAPDEIRVFLGDPTKSALDQWNTQSVDHAIPALSDRIALDQEYDDLSVGEALLIDAGEGTGTDLATPRLRIVLVEEIDAGPEQVATLTAKVSRIAVRETIRGIPTPAGGGRHFARTETGTLVMVDRSTPSTAFIRLYETIASDPSVTQPAADRWDTFARAPNGSLRQVTLSAGVVSDTDLDGQLVGTPAAISTGPGENRVFIRAPDGRLRTRRTDPVLGEWSWLGGDLASDPVPVVTGPGVLQVFAQGADRALWRRVERAGTWGDWERLRGVLATAPAAVSPVDGTVEVVALDPGGRLIHRREADGAWSDWQVLDGDLVGRLSLQATPTRLDVYATGRDGALWYRARKNGKWDDWESRGGLLASPPATYRDGAYLAILARGMDGSLMERVSIGFGLTDWRAMGQGMPAIPDRRRARIWRLAPGRLRFRAYDYPPRAEGALLAMRLPEGADGEDLARLATGRRAAVLGRGGAGEIVEIGEASAFAIEKGTPPDHLAVGLKSALSAPLMEARLRGNLARASHGETQPAEVFPGGRAAQPLTKIRLGSGPLTHLSREGSLTGAPELDLRVAGARWHPVESLWGQPRQARVFTLRETEAGVAEITMGGGRFGAGPAPGPTAIEARYRTGAGREGRVADGQLSVLLEKPPGLRAVDNPFAATGGVDPETAVDGAKASVAKLRAFDRVVSLEDFAAVAVVSGLAAKAHATWVWRNLERVVHLSVAGPGGEDLGLGEIRLLAQTLNGLRLPYRALTIASLLAVPVTVKARVVAAPDTPRENALAAARAALVDLFAFEAVEIGRPVHLSALYAALHEAPGIVAADVDVFQLRGWEDFTPAELAVRSLTPEPLQPHLFAYPARPRPGAPGPADPVLAEAFGTALPDVLPAEQMRLLDPERDLILAVTEML